MTQSKNVNLFHRLAKQRLEDARFLLKEDRTSAAVYLAGYSVECIVKSLILASVPAHRQAEVLKSDSFKGKSGHDYDALLLDYRSRSGLQIPREVAPHFGRVHEWGPDMRYQPGRIALADAESFLESVEAIVRWAESRL